MWSGCAQIAHHGRGGKSLQCFSYWLARSTPVRVKSFGSWSLPPHAPCALTPLSDETHSSLSIRANSSDPLWGPTSLLDQPADSHPSRPFASCLLPPCAVCPLSYSARLLLLLVCRVGPYFVKPLPLARLERLTLVPALPRPDSASSASH